MLAGLELTVTPTLMSATPTPAEMEELVTYVVLSPPDTQVNNYVHSLLTQILLILFAHLNKLMNTVMQIVSGIPYIVVVSVL